MNLNKSVISTFLIMVMIIGIQIFVDASEEPQHPLAGNDYVLRSCMSSVELKRRDIDSAKSIPPALQHRRRGPLIRAVQSPIPRYNEKFSESKTRETLRRQLRWGRPAREMIADTPLKTLNVGRRGRKDGPQIYVKKDRLPEAQSPVSDGNKNEKNEASIIVIESTRQFPPSR